MIVRVYGVSVDLALNEIVGLSVSGGEVVGGCEHEESENDAFIHASKVGEGGKEVLM